MVAQAREHGLPSEFADDVLDVVDQIPEGMVMTYGDIAELLGRGGARGVGTVMARYGSDVPWWRVIRAGHSTRRWPAAGTPGGPDRRTLGGAGTFRVGRADADGVGAR